ncbi:hypothetical protein Tco_1158879 [Tanacetum coccineum]
MLVCSACVACRALVVRCLDCWLCLFVLFELWPAYGIHLVCACVSLVFCLFCCLLFAYCALRLFGVCSFFLVCVRFDSRVIDDVSFDGMSFKDFFAIIRRLVLVSPTSMYYKIPSDPFTALKLLKTDEDLEQNGYDIMDMSYEELHLKKPVSYVDSDSDGDINVPLDDVAHVVVKFEHENMGRFLLEVEDPDDEQVESKFKAKQDVTYPFFNPDTPWNECKPVLGMRFESPQQLKHIHANYGKCNGLKGKKPKTAYDDECETSKQGSKKVHGRKAVNETFSKAVKERWNKKNENEKKRVFKQGGLLDHYSKLWQYRHTILDTHRGSTCVLENEVNDEDGKLYFRRDLNNQMFPIAWAIVGVENNQNWSWFLSLIRNDLNMGDGGGINIILNGHKEHQFNMDMEAVYQFEREQMAIEDVAAEKQPMIEDEPLQGGADLPTQENTIEANPKPTRSKKSKVAAIPNQMRIFHKNRGRSERIFNQKMKNFKFDEHGTLSTSDKAFDVE